ncbi:MAG: DegT/DnrJ/EryC1/StrS family aminotransferase [Candidatus Nitrosotenuis sp.]
MNHKIKLFDPVTDIHEEKIIKKVLQSHFWASGAGIGFVSKFENAFKNYIGSDYCIAVNNGTSALHLALSLFDIKDKEVLVPSLSFVSTAHAVIHNGGIPKFIDVDYTTLCMDVTQIKKSITKKTKIVLPVHFAGMPCNLDEINSICHQHDLVLIEDAAHACGSVYKNKKIGTHGSAVCFSFHPVKNLAMPTGGAITINEMPKKTADILKSRRWCGITNRKGPFYDVKHLGWNYYLNEFSAAIGLVQLKKLDRLNNIRKKIARRYHNEIKIEHKMPFNRDCSYHFYWLLVKNRTDFMKKMHLNGIETGIHYKPIHKMSYYKNSTRLPITEKTSEMIVSIPIHPNLSESDVTKIIESVNKFA